MLKTSKNILFPILIILLYAFSTSAHSMALSGYIEHKDKPELKEFFLNHIGGVGDGIFWSNSFAKSRYGQNFFCPPANLVLEPKNYVKILNRHIESGEKISADSLTLALFVGLVRSFPCDSE